MIRFYTSMKTSDYDGIKENVWCVMIYKNILCNIQGINLKCIYLERERERERRGRWGGGCSSVFGTKLFSYF